MKRREVAAIVLYALLLGSLATPMHESYFAGRVDWWAPAGMVVAATAGLGAVVARRWVLLLPVAAVAVSFVLNFEADASVVLAVPFAAIMAAIAATGVALGQRERGRRAGAVALALAVVPVAWGAVEHVRRGEVLDRAAQERLPIELSLGNLCPGAASDSNTVRRVSRSADALLVELDRRPYDLVDYTIHWAHEPPEETRITIRELAEEGLADLRSGGMDCAPALRRRIEDAL